MAGELIYAQKYDFINKEVPITSFGSCFATEVAFWLQQNNYNYLIGEHATKDKCGLYRAGSDWGNIYNTPSFFQLLKWITGKEERPFHFYRVNNQLFDPFCEEIIVKDNNIVEYKNKVFDVYSEAFDLIKKSKVLILTVGLNEVYKYLPTMTYMFRGPKGLNPACFSRKTLSIEENYQYLNASVEILNEINPDLKVICSVSPVPLIRSFQSDRHVAESTLLSKCILRLALDKFSDNKKIFYFPSFETAMYPGFESPQVFKEDERHVDRQLVDKIMLTFEKMFCKDRFTVKSFNFGKSALTKNDQISLDIANESITAIQKEIRIEKSFIDKFRDSLAPNTIRNGCNSNLAHSYFRTLSVQTGLLLNHIQGKLYKESGNSYTADAYIRQAAFELDQKGYFLIKSKGADDLMKAFSSFFKYFKLESENTGRKSFHGELINDSVEQITGDIKHKFDKQNLPVNVIASYLQRSGVTEIAKAVLGRIGCVRLSGWTNLSRSHDQLHLDKAALKFHFDLDSMGKWIKSFVFLNDVDEYNGPHVFVEGSHFNLKKEFHKDGRFENEYVEQFYPGSVKKFTAKAGDILLVNTIGLHRGSSLLKGNRDLVEATICNTAFGKPYNKSDEITGNKLFELLFT